MCPQHRRHIFAGPRGLALAEGCWGAALLLDPGSQLRSLAAQPIDPLVIKTARVLGARQLLQALITAWRPTRRTLQVGAAVDALHAATMVAAATANLGPRRLAIASSASATIFTAAGLAASWPRSPRRESRSRSAPSA